MSEMVERIARAIFAKKWSPIDADGFFFPLEADGLSSKGVPRWKLYEEDARTAIEEMRVPTKNMINAGNRETMDGRGADESWPHMIDEALK